MTFKTLQEPGIWRSYVSCKVVARKLPVECPQESSAEAEAIAEQLLSRPLAAAQSCIAWHVGARVSPTTRRLVWAKGMNDKQPP